MITEWRPSPSRVIATSWWLAAELVRRHPHLAVIERHPGGGQYDCLALATSATGMWKVVLDLNRAGSALVPGGSESWRDVWTDHLAHDDAHEAVRRLEQLAGLGAPTAPPTPAALVCRIIAEALALGVSDKAFWDARNEIEDTSGWEGGERGYLDRFDARDRMVATDADPFGNTGYRFWALTRDGKPVALFDTAGLAFVDGHRFDLSALYRPTRRIFPVVAAVLGGVLP